MSGNGCKIDLFPDVDLRNAGVKIITLLATTAEESKFLRGNFGFSRDDIGAKFIPKYIEMDTTGRCPVKMAVAEGGG
jgi:hypothetical protein